MITSSMSVKFIIAIWREGWNYYHRSRGVAHTQGECKGVSEALWAPARPLCPSSPPRTCAEGTSPGVAQPPRPDTQACTRSVTLPSVTDVKHLHECARWTRGGHAASLEWDDAGGDTKFSKPNEEASRWGKNRNAQGCILKSTVKI